MADFDLSREIDRYASRICQDIRSGKKRREVKREYVEHLEDATYQYMLRGMTDAEAFEAACDALGDMFKMQTLLAVAHNGDGLPRWFRWFLGFLSLCALAAGHLWAEQDAVRAASGFALTILLIGVFVRCLHESRLFVRALIKRKHAKMRIVHCAEENGLVFTEQKNPYLSLLVRSGTPEWVVDTPDCRYILSLFPTFRHRNRIHFYENGLYTVAKQSFFVSRFAFGRYYTMQDAEFIRGIYHMPPIDFGRYHTPDKENIHVLLLNPIPFEIDFCRNGHVCKLHPNEAMSAPYGGARACSTSDLIRQLNISLPSSASSLPPSGT